MPDKVPRADTSRVETFVTGIREVLAAAQDPGRAPLMQAYMKSELPYFGIASPDLKRLLRGLLVQRLETRADWDAAVRMLWGQATHREEWYAALALAGHRHYRAHQDPAALSLYRQLIVSGAWWDVVDDIASHRVGAILAAYPNEVTPLLRHWAVDDDLWIRRTAIICQLRAKHETDLDLLDHALTSNLEGSAYGSVFWIRKAVGWALRQYARTDPDWVRAFVAAHEHGLSGLSRREALKHLAG